ncbi:dihydrofolate reductase family protein [Gryllotalpicola ginsengisoli]|uniref:dihydrofolate reductase family protein n=1 Tax=Gryllotalpicola ginsengisoli TaxID=444608 RepID=UPI000484FBF5|nr:dihydrofolate reductase family protein [Gryllotalpicola ginsengisoli]
MTEVIYRTAVSFNGFIADESNSLDWLFAVDHSDVPDASSFLQRVGVIVEGSTTYEWVLAHTEVLQRPGQWREFYGDRPTYVFTTRRLTVPAGADVRFVAGPVRDVLAEIIAAADGKNVWVTGGGDLAGQFADIGALNRIELTLAPVALAAGSAVFPRRLESSDVRLASVTQHGQFVDVSYTVAASQGAR